MKLLVIGYDGGDSRVIQGMETPFFKEKFAEGISHQTAEDMWSRGWVEMMTGVHGRETLAFNELPVLDGSHKFTLSYSWKQMLENPEIKPIWEMLTEKGVRTGFMNVPTTSPAPKNDGFFVSGSGGGINAVFGVPKEMCDSKETADFLNERNYVVDIRRTSSDYDDLEKFFEGLRNMVEVRANCFIELCQKKEIDFGFVAFRAHVEVQNFAMYEVQKALESIAGTDESEKEERLMQKLIKDFYRHCDEVTRNIVENLNPEHVIFTGDHGGEVYRYQGNVDIFLEKHGFRKSSAVGQSAKKATGALLSSGIGKWVKAVVKKMPRSLKDKAQGTSWSGTQAFGNHYVPGIYLNDSRFGGPVPDDAREGLVKKLCDLFNKEPEAIEHNMKARPYRGEYPNAFFSDALPDVWIDRPDHIFFTNRGDGLITPNPNLGPIDCWPEQGKDFHTGVKGRYALLLTSASLEPFYPEDMTTVGAVYHIAQNLFSE